MAFAPTLRCNFLPTKEETIVDRQTFFSDFNRSKIICILRNVPAEKVIPVSEALYLGGIRFLAVAFHMSSSLALT